MYTHEEKKNNKQHWQIVDDATSRHLGTRKSDRMLWNVFVCVCVCVCAFACFGIACWMKNEKKN